MKNCNHEKILLLAGGELPANEAAELRAHLADCADCAAELSRLREGFDLLATLPPLEPSAALSVAVRQHGHKFMAHNRIIRPHFISRYRYAMTAAALLMAVFCWSLLNPPQVARILQPDHGQLSRLWDSPALSAMESQRMADELEDLYVGDAWSQATSQVMASRSSMDIDRELQELEQSLGLGESSL